MKFIGQYIQDFIARFRSDVYLEDISTGTIASGGNLGLDSNNKIVKNTVGGGGTTDLTSDVTGILPVANGGTGQNSLGSVNISDLNNDSGFTANTGDITSIKFTSSVGSHTESSGAAEFVLAGTAPLTVTNVNETFTVNAANASTTSKGVASFSSDNFAASSGAISIKSGGVDLTDEVTGTLPVGNGGTGLTSISTLLNSNVTTISGNAGTATTLETERDLQVDLSSTSADGFDGGANATDIGVKNTLGEGNGGTGVTDVKQIITRQAFQCNFIDDIGTTKHYLPLAGIQENTVRYQDEAAMLAPCDGRVASVTLKMENLGGASGNITFGVEVLENPGIGFANTWTTVETETFAIASTHNHDTFHFHFTQSTAGANSGTSKHFDATMMWAISIQSDDASLGGDGGNDERWFITAVVEWDWSTYLGTEGTTTRYTSVP